MMTVPDNKISAEAKKAWGELETQWSFFHNSPSERAIILNAAGGIGGDECMMLNEGNQDFNDIAAFLSLADPFKPKQPKVLA